MSERQTSASNMAGTTRAITPLLSKFRGCLAAANIADCLGANFEGFSSNQTQMSKVSKFMTDLGQNYKDGKTLVQEYTDDTAMAHQVAQSLIHNKGFNAAHMARCFSEGYLKEPNRGYGYNVTTVFRSLQKTDYIEPYKPAADQFDGSGSYGNGGAMRIAPAALFGCKMTMEALEELTKQITLLTHSHREGINGAILECDAIHLALQKPAEEKIDSKAFVSKLIERMKQLETDSREDGSDGGEEGKEKKDNQTRSQLASGRKRKKSGSENHIQPYCEHLDHVIELLDREEVPVSEIEEKLGTEVSALGSVPTAIYVFLKSLNPIIGVEESNPVKRTIMYAISLGGDTDTIATMAAAMTGAYYGIEMVPPSWIACCEGTKQALAYADQLCDLTNE